MHACMHACMHVCMYVQVRHDAPVVAVTVLLPGSLNIDVQVHQKWKYHNVQKHINVSARRPLLTEATKLITEM